jgi:TRAP-type C4-dicarboxylate transport system permease small subunit
MDWMKILSVVAGVMMLVFMWPAYKWWSKNSPKAQPGDWWPASCCC